MKKPTAVLRDSMKYSFYEEVWEYMLVTVTHYPNYGWETELRAVLLVKLHFYHLFQSHSVTDRSLWNLTDFSRILPLANIRFEKVFIATQRLQLIIHLTKFHSVSSSDVTIEKGAFLPPLLHVQLLPPSLPPSSSCSPFFNLRL